MPRQYLCLFISRLDQPVADAAMLGAFAERKDIFGAGLQMIVDHDAAVDGNAGLFRQRGVGPDAGGKDHRVRLQHAAVGQFDAFDARRAMNSRGVGVEQHFYALGLDQGFQQGAGRCIELALHQPVHQMDQRHRRAGLCQTIGGFQPEQPATDHDDALPCRRQGQQQVDVAGVAKGVDARKIRARQIEPQRARAGGQHQPRIGDAFFVGDLEFTAADIDLGGSAAIFEGNAAVAPPFGGPEFDVVRLGLARQHRRQQHSVVGQPRLLADHGDGVTAKRDLCQLIDQPRGGHAIANDNQRFAHGSVPTRHRHSAACARP